MKSLLVKIRNIICYCGLSKEDYRDIKKQAYISNFIVWRVLHFIIALILLSIGMAHLSNDGFTTSTMICFACSIYSVVVGLIFVFVFEEDSLLAQFIIYLTMTVLILSSFHESAMTPDMGAVSFIALLVLLPMFMIDKPYFMIGVISIAVTLYLSIASGFKTARAFRMDCTYCIVYGLLGMMINTFYNFIRIRELTFQKQEANNLKEQKKLNDSLKDMTESVVDVLGDIVESRDTESGEHIKRVKGYTFILANQVMNDVPRYGLDKYTVDLITFTSALHDVGKIFIPDTILCKRGKLTEEEFEIMKTHCEKGVSIIENMLGKWSDDYMAMAKTICLNHHEKWDGRGYPRGLKGDEIPIAAQIVSIADIYDALTTKRVYKDAYPLRTAYEMIISGQCGSFSQDILNCFDRCREKFEQHAKSPSDSILTEREFELVSTKHPGDSFVIGLYDQNKSLRDRVRLDEEVSVFKTLAEKYYYVCYIDMRDNIVRRFMADPKIERLLDSYNPALKSNERFDMLLNEIIDSRDLAYFMKNTERNRAMSIIKAQGFFTTDFRINLDDGMHYCRMKLAADPNNSDAVIIGISSRDYMVNPGNWKSAMV